MRDHGELKRPLSRGAKQQRMRPNVRQRRRHQPLLHAPGRALIAGRAESGLRERRMRREDRKQHQQ